jgi:hypothetical protein
LQEAKEMTQETLTRKVYTAFFIFANVLIMSEFSLIIFEVENID